MKRDRVCREVKAQIRNINPDFIFYSEHYHDNWKTPVDCPACHNASVIKGEFSPNGYENLVTHYIVCTACETISVTQEEKEVKPVTSKATGTTTANPANQSTGPMTPTSNDDIYYWDDCNI